MPITERIAAAIGNGLARQSPAHSIRSLARSRHFSV